MEQKKNNFLVALYEKNFQTAEQIYIDILKHAESQSRFRENFEKHLRQIQTIFKRFKPDLLKHCTPGINNCHNRLENLILAATKQSSGHIRHADFKVWEKNLGLDHRRKNLLYKTAMTFQLTSGCSNYCRRCNEWALPKVRSHFSYQAILEILNHMEDQQNDEISLYGASDPLDWTEEKKTISDILEYFEKTSLEYSILTKVPKGKELLLKNLLTMNSNLSVSITSKNKARIKDIEQEFGEPISKQHDLDELLIPAGRDEDFISIKPSITDGYGVEITPDGAFIIIPTFTSALHPFGHKKIRVTSGTNFFPVKKTGRHALLVDYFKPLEAYDLNQNRYHLDGLLDVQIESIILDNGTDELTPPGMRSLKEYLSIFEEKPRLQRKKIGRHLALCEKEGCRVSKLYTISFFLESISRYVQKDPVKTKIMQFLLKEESETHFNTYTTIISHRPPEDLLVDPDIDSFDIFRFFVFCLLNRSDDSTILEFIKNWPSAYDPVEDIFAQSCR